MLDDTAIVVAAGNLAVADCGAVSFVVHVISA